MKLATAQVMKDLDRRATEQIGLPGMVLMENAARGAFRAMLRFFPDLAQRRVGVLAGRGNNGGDALAVARYLLNRGIISPVFLLARRDELRGDAAANLAIFTKLGGEVVEVAGAEEFAASRSRLAALDLFVDGIFGTGLNGPVSGLLHEVIAFINRLQRPVVSLDIPSGLQADSGQVLGICLQASLTVTFGLVKRGLAVEPGASLCGRLVLVDISLPRSLIDQVPGQDHLLQPGDFLSLLSPREPEAHKGNFGHLLVLSGSLGKTGAAAMVGQGALRVGAGLVTVAVPESLNPILEVKLTEAMTEPMPETAAQTLSRAAVPKLLDLARGKAALAIGPGLSTEPETVEVVRDLLSATALPAVVDADGLTALAGRLDLIRQKRASLILTPHPGEMARLTGKTSSQIQQTRIQTARAFARDMDLVLVLKGARSLIASPAGEVFINPAGNPGMASGGMGDVLTGMIGGFLAQGLAPLDAAKLAVYLHGLAGDYVARLRGERGMVATDLIDQVPGLLNALAAGQTRLGEFSFPPDLEAEL